MGTHFSSGVTNVARDDEMGILRTMDPSQYYQWNVEGSDFFTYTSANWVKTDTGTGTVAVVDGAGGLLALTNAAAGASDALQIQYNGASAAARLQIFWDSTKDLIIKARFKVDSVANSACWVGASTVDTSLIASLPTDGIYFYKATGSGSVIASVRKAGTSSSVTLGTMADDTFATMSMFYSSSPSVVNGPGNLWRMFYNGAMVGGIANTTNSPTNGLCVGMAMTNSTAVAHLLTLDYLNIFVSRT